MKRETLSDLAAFAAVARMGSFTRAAAQLGLSQSGLSHVIRGLEDRLGLRLLARTTRSVSLTEAGARLLATLGPRLDEIEAELANLADLRDRPSGTIRITTGDHAAQTILMPKLLPFLLQWPDIKLELSIDYALTDIVSQRFDAGVRLGEQVAQDMIALPIGPPIRMAVAAAPAYLQGRPRPLVPQDLTQHRCLNLRLETLGGLYAWEFSQAGRSLRVRVDGPLTVNRSPELRQAALAGLGIAYLPEDRLTEDFATGRLIRLLADWTPPEPGYHLYYPSRRQPSAAFEKLIETLRSPHWATAEPGPAGRF